MKNKKIKKPKIRFPIPPPGKPHSSKKGKRGYNRKHEKKKIREATEDFEPASLFYFKTFLFSFLLAKK